MEAVTGLLQNSTKGCRKERTETYTTQGPVYKQFIAEAQEGYGLYVTRRFARPAFEGSSKRVSKPTGVMICAAKYALVDWKSYVRLLAGVDSGCKGAEWYHASRVAGGR